MKSSRVVSLKRSLLLATFAGISVFSATAAAQSTNTNNDSNQSTTQANQATSTSSRAATTASSSSTSQATRVITNTNTNTAATSTDAGTLPTITGTSADSGNDLDLPTLTRTTTGIPTYPAPSVPPTELAPYMQHSNLPEGTVFIAVGAILGAFGLTVLVWRAIIACLLHRDVERAATAQHAANDKAAGSFPAPPAPFYKSYNESGSNPNLLAAGAGAGAGLGAAASSASVGRGVRRTHRGPTPSATPSQSNLFFSPTAASGLGGGGGGGSVNRDSRFLPSGFYAAGASSPGGPRHEHSISLSNLRPDSRGHARAVTPPEDSPNFGPSRSGTLGHAGGVGGVHRNVSTSTLNLTTPPTGRAPSAYLDDMLDDPSVHAHMMGSPVAGRSVSQFSAGSPSPQPHQPLTQSPQSRGYSPSPGRY